MDADRWSGSTGARWPCYLPNSGISVSSYVGEALSEAASSVCWLSTTCTCSPSCTTCRQSLVDVTATESSSSHTHLPKPAAAAAAAEANDKQINDTGKIFTRTLYINVHVFEISTPS